jgi:uncharacterized protein YfaS (alpha-2-macroglobulin family)
MEYSKKYSLKLKGADMLKMRKMRVVWYGCVGVGMALLSMAWAVSVANFSPQGEIDQAIKQIRVTFSAPMVHLGKINAPAPLTLSCAIPAQGRWVDERTWVIDLQELPLQQTCYATIKPGLKSSTGEVLTGKKRFSFSTGPLAIKRTWPSEGDSIDEEQTFLVQYNAQIPVPKPALFCQVEDSPERIPVIRLPAKDRDSLIKYFKLEKYQPQIEAVSCMQRLPAGKRVQLSLLQSPSRVQKWDFTVRKEFKATFTCQRENAQADCLPLSPIALEFSEAVPRQVAEKIRIVTPTGERKPVSHHSEGARVYAVTFAAPFPVLSELQIILPKDFKDETGRTLVNAAAFPLKIKMADAPPLAKFAAAPFGIVEWTQEAAVPITVRHVENRLPIHAVTVGVGDLAVKSDQDIMHWLRKVYTYHAPRIQQTVKGKKEWVQTRSISLLKQLAGVKKLNVLLAADKTHTRPFEVVGLPIKEPGLHILEVKSPLLGHSLLGTNAPMYVRTAALVTNLGVHLKQGRNNAAVWVSTLDRAQPVSAATVRIYDCQGKLLWQGNTGKEGVAQVNEALTSPTCQGEALEGLLVIARKKDDKGREDVSFVRSVWNQGIEAWRFPVPTTQEARPALIGHTVFDRMLFRAGETVSMKHFLRIASAQGLGLVQAGQLPTQIRIVHNGSGHAYLLPLTWRHCRYAETSFTLPKAARLGTYSVILEKAGRRQHSEQHASVEEDGVTLYSGTFRVEAFRLPVMTGQLTIDSPFLLSGQSIPLMVSMKYSAGGPAKDLPVQVSAMLQRRYHVPAAYSAFSFWAPEKTQQGSPTLEGKVIIDKADMTLDGHGTGMQTGVLPLIDRTYDVVTEATYQDPNGEIQTISRTWPIWPAALQVGLAVDNWVSVKRNIKIKAVVLDLQDKPVANQKVQIKALRHHYLANRKRLVGGFYAYESEKVTQDLGTVCKTSTDARGLAFCEVALKESGNIELVATVEDNKSRQAQASQSVWVSSHDEVWFDMQDNDRIDVLPEKSEYNVGDTARFQVRMPFRQATAWVAVEREGIVETQVIKLKGNNPSFDLMIKSWAPNVFVSVLALRGRVREVPWYSFFTWGWKTPLNWWDAYWHEGKDYAAPTAMVDLGKPAFKYGLTEIKVNDASHRLNVTVKADKATYQVRKMAQVQIQVNMPDGRPAPRGTEVVFAAVDEALLELMPNRSWNIVDAMLQQRSYGVETSTAQLQVVGKRHFGRKALEPGGGGGEAPTRELFNTLLLWEPKLILNAQGRATVKVPLNDSLTRFRFVAIADVGTRHFGTGSTQVTVTQDVQLLSGLPTVVREGDQLKASVTVRNGTTRAMKLTVHGQATGFPNLAAQTVQLAAGQAQEVSWPITIPAKVSSLQWDFSALEQGSQKVHDQLTVTQQIESAVPVTVQQATLQQLPVTLPVGLAAAALPGRGDINVQLQAKLSALPAVREWFLRYPFNCLEQRLSSAVGLQDKARWDALMQDIALYLDEDGLVDYFPTQEGQAASGSDTLTAYILALAHEAGWAIPALSRDKMLQGLARFVEGRIQRKFWSPRHDISARKLAALEALARYHAASPRQLTSVEIQPKLWTTAMLIDWLSLLQRMPTVPDRAKRLTQAQALLRAKMVYQGTRLSFVNERQDNWWWLMGNSDVNAAKLWLTVHQLPSWKKELPHLLMGLLSRQQQGVWQTTNANAWGSLAVMRFSQQFESEPVTGRSVIVLGEAKQTVNWTSLKPEPVGLNWPRHKETLRIQQEGSGKPWATIEARMALPLKVEQVAGFRIKKMMTPVQQKTRGVLSQGDIIRVTLDVEAQTDMTWVVVNDPVPAGVTILGSGLGRDATLASQPKTLQGVQPVYIERHFTAYQAYYRYVPQGKFTLQYTMRINTPGTFTMPPTRVEGLYAPDVFGAIPNSPFKVVHAK